MNEKKFCKFTVGTGETKIVPEANLWDEIDKVVVGGGTVVHSSITHCDENGNISPTTQANAEEVSVVSNSVPVDANSTDATPDTQRNPVAKNVEPVYSTWGSTVIDQEAKTRIEDLHNKLRAAGSNIDTSQQFFETGTRMAREGYETQHKRKQEHDAMRSAKDVIDEAIATITAESREDHDVSAREMGKSITVQGKDIFCLGHLMTEHAIRQLLTRLGSPSLKYVLGLQDRIYGNTQELNSAGGKRLQDIGVVIANDIERLADTVSYECSVYGDEVIKLRTRKSPHDIFAVLSNTYGVADAPEVLKQILPKLATDAKGSFAYDPNSVCWELRSEIFTATEVDNQSVGEVFSSYISFTSADNGTRRFRGGGGINLLRCLNASTYSADSTEGSRVHKGRKVVYDINGIIKNAMKGMHILCEAWGKRRNEEIDYPEDRRLDRVIPGIYDYLLKDSSSELAGVLVGTGRTKDHIKNLTNAYFEQRRDLDRVVRSDIAQGWTRYIQDQPTQVRRDGELAIGAWLVNNNKPIKFKELEK